jgi:hypothetical protein
LNNDSQTKRAAVSLTANQRAEDVQRFLPLIADVTKMYSPCYFDILVSLLRGFIMFFGVERVWVTLL